MPLVQVRYRSGMVGWRQLQVLQAVLPGEIASVLSVRGNEQAHVSSRDIVLHVDPTGPFDVVRYDVVITVHCMYFKEREKALQDRLERMKASLAQHVRGLEGLTFLVFVLMSPAAAFIKHE